MAPSSGLINLLELLTELRKKHFTYWIRVIIKGWSSRTAGGEDALGEVWEGTQLPCPLQVCTLPEIQPEGLQMLCSWVFMETFIVTMD